MGGRIDSRLGWCGEIALISAYVGGEFGLIRTSDGVSRDSILASDGVVYRIPTWHGVSNTAIRALDGVVPESILAFEGVVVVDSRLRWCGAPRPAEHAMVWGRTRRASLQDGGDSSVRLEIMLFAQACCQCPAPVRGRARRLARLAG